MSTAIIYNRLNSEALLATAILMAEFTEDVCAYDVTQLVEEKAAQYVWIGVDPRANFEEFLFKTKDKEHRIFVSKEEKKAYTATKLFNFWTKKQVEVEESSDGTDVVFRNTLIHDVCQAFGLTNEDYVKLDFHMARFHKKMTEIEYLAFIYANLVEADIALTNSVAYRVKSVTTTDIADYLDNVKRVKSRLESRYAHAVCQDGEVVKKALHTSFHGFEFHLALRIMKLAHKNFLNTSMGMSGAILYSNMRYLHIANQGKKPMLLN